MIIPELAQFRYPLVFRFTTDRPLRVQARLGLDKGPLLAVPMDWKALPAGEHEVVWNGKGEDGRLAVSEANTIKPIIRAYTLPDNAILTRGNPVDFCMNKYTKIKQSGQWKALLDLGSDMDVRPQPLGFHSNANRTRLEDRSPDFSFQTRTVLSSEGERSLRVTVDLDEMNRWIMSQRRYEIKLYVNGDLIIEEEQGYTPYTFDVPWNAAWTGDEILVTVNVATLHDQVGSQSRFLTISR